MWSDKTREIEFGDKVLSGGGTDSPQRAVADPSKKGEDKPAASSSDDEDDESGGAERKKMDVEDRK